VASNATAWGAEAEDASCSFGLVVMSFEDAASCRSSSVISFEDACSSKAKIISFYKLAKIMESFCPYLMIAY